MLSEIQNYIAELERQGRSERTRDAYASDLTRFAEWFGDTNAESFRARAITYTDVLEYRRYMQVNRGLAPATVNRRLSSIRAFCRWAIVEGELTEDPTSRVVNVQTVSTSPQALTRRELGKLIRAAEQDALTGAANGIRDLAILQILRHTGLRVGELTGLTLEDIELNDRSGSVTVRSGKGEAHRIVPLNLSARRDLLSYLKVRPSSKDGHVFLSQKGGGLSSKAVQRIVAKYAHRAELPDVTPHILRHSFAKDVLDRGESLTTVAALLGHQNIQTTAIYTQPSNRDLTRAVESIAEEGTE